MWTILSGMYCHHLWDMSPPVLPVTSHLYHISFLIRQILIFLQDPPQAPFLDYCNPSATELQNENYSLSWCLDRPCHMYLNKALRAFDMNQQNLYRSQYILSQAARPSPRWRGRVSTGGDLDSQSTFKKRLSQVALTAPILLIYYLSSNTGVSFLISNSQANS